MILRHRQGAIVIAWAPGSETMLAAAAIDAAEKRLTRGLIDIAPSLVASPSRRSGFQHEWDLNNETPSDICLMMTISDGTD
jgi:hypothetical protein